jgi:hypothetical protein
MAKEWTYYVGRTAEGYAVYAELHADVSDKGRTVTFTDHTTTDGLVERVSVMWVVADVKGTAADYATGGTRSMSSGAFDRMTLTSGQVPPESRVIVTPAIDADTLAFIERAWAEQHLNDMHAECDHMRPGVDYVEPDPAELPLKYGAPDMQGWKLDNVVCAAGTGYRWGHAWLAKRVPADVWTRFAALAMGRGR